MNRRTLATIAALVALATGALTAAAASDGSTPTAPSSGAPTATPSVGSIVFSDPLHGLTDAVAQGVHTLYEQAAGGSGL